MLGCRNICLDVGLIDAGEFGMFAVQMLAY